MRVVRFGEFATIFSTSSSGELRGQYSIIFYENGNDKRKYTVKGSLTEFFNKTPQFAQCETWVHTGLFPEWAKDAMAEKLVR